MEETSELKRDLASERFGDSKTIEGTLVFAVEFVVAEPFFLMGFFWEVLFWGCKSEIGNGICSCTAEVLALRRADTGD